MNTGERHFKKRKVYNHSFGEIRESIIPIKPEQGLMEKKQARKSNGFVKYDKQKIFQLKD